MSNSILSTILGPARALGFFIVIGSLEYHTLLRCRQSRLGYSLVPDHNPFPILPFRVATADSTAMASSTEPTPSAEGGCPVKTSKSVSSWWSSFMGSGKDEHPADQVRWCSYGLGSELAFL